uniref:Uncharacterized protein n=1 Tax=Oryza meridionalis TaxID=40149 RepID=A0A0E0D1F5_9ORYZ
MATRRGGGVSAGEGGVSGGNSEAAGSAVATARRGVSGSSGEAAGSAAVTARRGVGGDNDEARGRRRRCSRAAASTPSAAPLPSLSDPAKGEERKERWRRLPLEVATSGGSGGAPHPWRRRHPYAVPLTLDRPEAGDWAAFDRLKKGIFLVVFLPSYSAYLCADDELGYRVGVKEKIGVKPGEMFLDLESEAGRGP